jgi:hypothetical protein
VLGFGGGLGTTVKVEATFRRICRTGDAGAFAVDDDVVAAAVELAPTVCARSCVVGRGRACLYLQRQYSSECEARRSGRTFPLCRITVASAVDREAGAAGADFESFSSRQSHVPHHGGAVVHQSKDLGECQRV